MQNTRLSSFVAALGQQAQIQLRNPWRRLAFLCIAVLLGFFTGIVYSAVAGQLAYLDVTVAALVLLLTEVISWAYYGNRWNLRRSLWGEAFNAFKIGIIYGLFLIAFMLGS